MTAPSYTEDLTDLNTAESATGWVEMTGTVNGEAYSGGGTPAGGDPDYPFIQGSYSVTQDCTKDSSVGSLCYNNGSDTGGHGTDGAFFVWHNFMVASNIGTYAQGGLQIVVGTSVTAFDVWYVGGVDKAPYPYGGWVCDVVNTTVTPDGTVGTVTTEQYIGSAAYIVTGPKKGEVHNCDVIRYGRGSAIFEYGEAADYAVISGFAAQNDNSSNRWGLIQETAGGYLWQGRMQLGTASNAVDFRDEDVIIFIKWTPKVTANFNTIEIINASSNIEMTNFQFICLDTSTASRGRFLMTNDADVALDGCTFIEMSTFVFSVSTNTVTVHGCTFKNCDQITHGGADFDSCVFAGYIGAADTAYLVYDVAADINGEIDNSSFEIGSLATHAIEFDTSTSTHTLTGIDFSGYNATNGSNDSALYFADQGSDTDWTINLVGCTGDISYKVARTGDTVTLVIDPVSVTVTVKDIVSGNLLENARVLIYPTDGTNFIYQEAFTFTGSGTSATATIDSGVHGLSTGDEVIIAGVSDDAYNGAFTVTVSSTTIITYTTVDTITSSSLSGNITMALVSKLTNASGIATESYSISADQPIAGRIRLSSATVDSKTAYFKQSLISGSVGSTSGFSATVQMVRDE